MALTAVIIDDELKLREVFRALLTEHCPEIELLGEASNITEGYNLIVNTKPQVVFLDIEMPGGNGFELLSRFEKIPFEIIFVSSYGHYAINAIRLSALDFLLKPILIDELIKIPEKIYDSISLKENALKYKMLQANLNNKDGNKKLVVKTRNGLEPLDTKTIVYIKADGNYTTIFFNTGEKLLVTKTLKYYEEILCEEQTDFIRIHKAYIVNVTFIKKVELGNESFVILKDHTMLEVSRRKKTLLNEKIVSGS